MSIQQAIVPAPLLMDNIKIEDYFVSSNLYFRTLGKNLCLLIDFQFEWSGCVILTFDRRILKTSKLLRFSKNFTNTKFLLNCYDIWMGWDDEAVAV